MEPIEPRRRAAKVQGLFPAGQAYQDTIGIPESLEIRKGNAPPQKDNRSQIIAVLQAIALVLAVRILLLLSIVGGFVLAVMAMRAPSTEAIVVLISYCCLTVLPLVWLERYGRR